mmetsp:Transcript_15139/g.37935  ORF Transcript_15139/g.37935 Transcript_15139/m.37935 type:complete len:213 (-) Transcript_15139:687-1325(-)
MGCSRLPGLFHAVAAPCSGRSCCGPCSQDERGLGGQVSEELEALRHDPRHRRPPQLGDQQPRGQDDLLPNGVLRPQDKDMAGDTPRADRVDWDRSCQGKAHGHPHGADGDELAHRRGGGVQAPLSGGDLEAPGARPRQGAEEDFKGGWCWFLVRRARGVRAGARGRQRFCCLLHAKAAGKHQGCVGPGGHGSERDGPGQAAARRAVSGVRSG